MARRALVQDGSLGERWNVVRVGQEQKGNDTQVLTSCHEKWMECPHEVLMATRKVRSWSLSSQPAPSTVHHPQDHYRERKSHSVSITSEVERTLCVLTGERRESYGGRNRQRRR